MRSTISTSLALAAAVLSAATGAAQAEGGPSHGCYARTYSATHLRANPAQVVERMLLRVRPEAPSGPAETVADMSVWAANQGHARSDGVGGERFDGFLFCWQQGKGKGCGIECDGGTLDIEIDDGRTLQFRTDYLMLGSAHDCGGILDLAERPGEIVSYRLERVADAVCTDELGDPYGQ